MTFTTDARRWLQLALAAVWLLDGLLQYQTFMFTPKFGSEMLASAADGNPSLIADSITHMAHFVAANAVWTNTLFATIQLALGIGIALRVTVRPALAASIVWSVAVWWFGEGFGGLLSGGASALDGAPGGVVLYALLAVLIWPVRSRSVAPAEPIDTAAFPRTETHHTRASAPTETRHSPAPTPAPAPAPQNHTPAPATHPPAPQPPARAGSFVATHPLGATASRVVWVVLWGGLAALNLQPANLGQQSVHSVVAGMGDGQPAWMTALVDGFATFSAHNGTVLTIIGTIILTLIAAGIFLPTPQRRYVIIAAIATSIFIWVFAQSFGALFGGGATDPNSGPLLALIACAYWPSQPTRTAPARATILRVPA